MKNWIAGLFAFATVLGIATPAIATFPTVDATSSGETASGTTHTPTLPTCATGKLLAGFFSIDANVTTSGWAGWTQVANLTSYTQSSSKFETRYRVATGSDSLSITTTSADTIAYIIRCIGNPHPSSAPEGSVAASSSGSTTPDPATLSPSWGAEDTLWLVVAAYDRGGTGVTISSGAANNGFPTNYTSNKLDQFGGSNTVGIGNATRQLNATSDDPGTFTLTGAGDTWYAGVLAIRPAPDAPPTTRPGFLGGGIKGGLILQGN